MNGQNPSEPKVWRSLSEFEETPATRELLESEFPRSALAPAEDLKRRTFLKMMAASLALAGGCTRQPIETIVPYVRQPEQMVPGEPLYFATAMPLSGYGTGIVVKSREGRPIKADGNALHPASGNGSDVWIQACLLDLYNPERAKAPTHLGNSSSYAAFLSWLNKLLADQDRNNGAGLRLLTGNITSPTLAAQMSRVQERFPGVEWHQWEPVNWDNSLEGSRLAFGEDLCAHYQLDQTAVIASFDLDFLHVHPQRLRYIRDFADGRRVVAGQKTMNRLYTVESSPSITGSMADHRLVCGRRQTEAAMVLLAAELGVPVNREVELLNTYERNWVAAMARDLEQNRAANIVMVGESLPPAFHALGEKINAHLGNLGATVVHRPPAQQRPLNHLASLADLVAAMERGAVDLLIILGGNPAFDAPANFEFAERLKQVKHSVHLSLEFNETSELCEWHIPQTHFLETWSDVRSFDGTATIMQPLIAPLFSGKSEHQLLQALLEVRPTRSDYDLVRASWHGQGIWENFESGWQTAVHNGVVAGTELPSRTPILQNELLIPAPVEPERAFGALEAQFKPDPHLWDGRFALNPWLQETPKPLTKLTWDNAVLISPALAARRKLATSTMVELRIAGRSMQAPVFILPGQAPNTLTLHFGHGRKPGLYGFNFYQLRTTDALWSGEQVSLEKLEGKYEFATTQTHHRIHDEDRQVYREGTLLEFLRNPDFVKEMSTSPPEHETLYDPAQYDFPIKWGMAVDLTTCVGCNACTVACNIENNIPVVGKQQVALNREMLWLRVDTYYSGSQANPRFNHQPVPCMHCENAPCEYVCPVGATLHDHEGLNVQVYNRCVGTRYCSNNCPYKVRRFNFLQYTDYGSELHALRHNPEVTVRWRGVMEKCTYCVQRISAARIEAKKEGTSIPDGVVKTACQEACPAGAIVFGIMSDPGTAVAKQKKHPLDFPMLGQLNTRPRTTYAAKLRNPNLEIEKS